MSKKTYYCHTEVYYFTDNSAAATASSASMARQLPSRETARTAVWAWYWRRVAVSLTMEASGIEVYKAVWPACLAWPEETVAHHEAAMRLLGVEVPPCA